MKNIFLAALAVVAITSCSKENDTTALDNDNRITFGSSIEATSRAVGETDTQFSDGETIGVIGYREASATATTNFTTPFMDKAVFTYGSNKFTSAATTAYWQRGKAHNFYAYYPSDLTINTLTAAAPTATLTVNATTGIGIDVMQAATETAVFDKSFRETALAFSHKLSKIKFEVKKEANTPASKLTKVEFTMANKTGEFNVATGAVANSGGSVVLSKTAAAQEINTSAASAFGAEWIVLPADVISGVKLTINGQVIEATNMTGTTTEEGKITTITINIKAVGIEMTSTITAWGNVAGSGDIDAPIPPAKIGDYYYKDETYSTDYKATVANPCIGIIYRLKKGQEPGMILSVEHPLMAWATNQGPITNNLYDGKVDYATIQDHINNSGGTKTWDNFPAFKYCNDRNTGGKNIGWHLPAEREAHAFYAGYCGLRWVRSGADASKGEINDWNYGSPGMPGASSYTAQHTYFNKQLSGATGIGVPFGQSVNFWTSTSTYGGDQANVMVISDACTSTGIMANKGGFGARCIRPF